MNRISSIGREKYGVLKSEKIIDLAEIYEENIQIVRITRGNLEDISRDLEKHKLQPLIQKEIVTRDDLSASEILNFLKDNKLTYLKEDIEYLIQIYMDLLDVNKIGLRFGVLESTLCPMFHTDYVGIRMICTYLGEGTEYVYCTTKNRNKLQDQYKNNQILEFQNIQKANPFDILLLKGRNYSDNFENGAIHRSPIITQGKHRIIMSIDWID